MADPPRPASASHSRPTLNLSGAKLRAALELAIRASEAVGGVERFVAALKLKSQVIAQRLGNGQAATLDRATFEETCQLMATVRRRVGPLLDQQGWPHVRSGIETLLHDAHVPGTADQRIADFEATLGRGATPTPRFLRDLAAEILHGVHPEHYPLMTRWVWDEKTNTGVLREIWHDPVAGDATDNILISVPSTHETFLVLREELSQFLSDNGIFRDMLWYVDLLQAQVYAGYINAQGGAWLKTDFGAESDPIEHTRRILGVDARIARSAAVDASSTSLANDQPRLPRS
jgi:hypothetical protein